MMFPCFPVLHFVPPPVLFMVPRFLLLRFQRPRCRVVLCLSVRLQQVGVPLKWRSELIFRTESSLLFFSHWLAFWVGRTCIFLRQFWLLNHVLTWFTLMSKYHYCILMMQLFAISKQLGCANILLIVKCLRGLWLYFVYENKVSFVVISHDALFLARAVLHSLQKAVPISRWCRTVNSRSYLHINLGLPSDIETPNA